MKGPNQIENISRIPWLLIYSGSKFSGQKLISVWPLRWKLSSSAFMWYWYCLLYYARLFQLLIRRRNSSVWTFKWKLLSSTFMPVYYIKQGCFNFSIRRGHLSVWSFKRNLLSSALMWYCLFCYTRWVYFKVFKPYRVTIQMKATTQHFHVVLFLSSTFNFSKELFSNLHSLAFKQSKCWR